MMKWIAGVLVLVNVLFFAVMQWGGVLAVDAGNPSLGHAINADKVRVLREEPVASMVLVSAVMAMSSPVVAATEASIAVPQTKLSCFEWGEFSGKDLQLAEKALGEFGLGDKLGQRVVEYSGGYWVYIAPMKTPAQVEQKIAQLRSRGVEDYFVVQEAGRWQNTISLGVFKTEEAAKNYLAKLQGQGVRTALVGERGSKLKFTVFTLNQIDGAQSSKLATLSKDFPESELKPVSCN